MIEIITEDSVAVTSKTDYTSATIKVTGLAQSEGIETLCKIRGRGNATWKDYPKKPYKIKFDTKISLFGFPANKDWVLLAEYCDKSLLRTAYMCEVSKAIGIDYTVNYQHVSLTLNGEYQGVYVLTDQVEKGKDRVAISDEGFLIEDDNYYEEELFFFTSGDNYHYTFKYPNPNKGKIVADDDNYVFIRDFINDMEEALRAIPVDCETYKSFVDIESFAKWYVAAEVTGNWEPNLFYALPSRSGKLKILPMWDAEWSLGLASKGNEQDPNGWFRHPYEPEFDIHIWNGRKYFKYLFKDPSFMEEVLRVWQDYLFREEIVTLAIRAKREEIHEVQKENFERWPILGKFIAVELVAFPTWEEEAGYVASYYENRIAVSCQF